MGYYTLSAKLWRPEKEEKPVNAVFEIEDNDTKLNKIDQDIVDYLKSERLDDNEEHYLLVDNFGKLNDEELVLDVTCNKFDINSLEEFIQSIGDVEFFPL